MDKLFTVVLYALWTLFLIGVLVITFTNFQYSDLNFIVSVLFFFTVINSFFAVRRK